MGVHPAKVDKGDLVAEVDIAGDLIEDRSSCAMCGKCHETKGHDPVPGSEVLFGVLECAHLSLERLSTASMCGGI